MVSQDRDAMDANECASSSRLNRSDDNDDILLRDQPLASPGVPRQMSVEPDGVVRTSCTHLPSGALTPGPRPGDHRNCDLGVDPGASGPGLIVAHGFYMVRHCSD